MKECLSIGSIWSSRGVEACHSQPLARNASSREPIIAIRRAQEAAEIEADAVRTELGVRQHPCGNVEPTLHKPAIVTGRGRD